jgi:hypothetical protein
MTASGPSRLTRRGSQCLLPVMKRTRPDELARSARDSQRSSGTVAIMSRRTSRVTVRVVRPTRLAHHSVRSESDPRQVRVAPLSR